MLTEIRRGVDILHHLILQRRQVNRSKIALRKARYFEMLPSEIHLRTLAVRSEPPPTGAKDKNTTAPTATANEVTLAPSVEASAMTTTEPAAMELDITAPAPAVAREPAPAHLWQHSQDSPIDYADVIEFFAKPSFRQTKPGMYFDEELVHVADRATFGGLLLMGVLSCASPARARILGTASVAPADHC